MDKNDINVSELLFKSDVVTEILPKKVYFYVHFSSSFLLFTLSLI